MSLASKKYYEIAKQVEEEMNLAINEQEKKELRKVAAQNYFYSGVEAIEHILKKSGLSIYSITNHKERLDIIKKYSRQFKDPAAIALKYEILINYDYRRKVAYKGENGNKFVLIREFADACKRELE
ncbi:hypothetical protein HYU07_04390 [Candidatus Woesearchaeota archaeon]|nr:hypothetical protein [Candidatus Woesearchaeota archaeon]